MKEADKIIFSLEGIPGCSIETAKKTVVEYGIALVESLDQAFELVSIVLNEDRNQEKPQIHDVNNLVNPMPAIFIEQKDVGKRILIVGDYGYVCDDLEPMAEMLEKHGVAVVSSVEQARNLFERVKMFNNPEWQKHNITIKISVVQLWMFTNAGGALMM